MNLRLHPLYKKLLLVLMVLGPIIWLMLTEDGKRRTDLVMLHLMGKQELNLSIEKLRGDVTLQELQALFPDLELSCTAAENPFGDRLCTAELGAFNSIPSRSFTLYLSGDLLRAAKVSYRGRYHETLQRQLTRQTGTPPGHRSEDGGALSWQVSDGLLLMPGSEPQSDDEAALMWLSTAALKQHAATGS